jgi:menaquinone-dependent protoporphyrinogen oxidase
MLFCYATRDGQARRIAERISLRLAEAGLRSKPQNLAENCPGAADLQGRSPVIVVAAVRYGFHLPEANALLARYAALPAAAPLVLVSVNLTARKPGKRSPEGNAYLRALIRRRRLQPAIAIAVAGRLDYPSYRWFDRLMIRFIMKLTGGPTDPTARVEFTDWRQVDELAERITALCARSLATDDLS